MVLCVTWFPVYLQPWALECSWHDHATPLVSYKLCELDRLGSRKEPGRFRTVGFTGSLRSFPSCSSLMFSWLLLLFHSKPWPAVRCQFKANFWFLEISFSGETFPEKLWCNQSDEHVGCLSLVNLVIPFMFLPFWLQVLAFLFTFLRGFMAHPNLRTVQLLTIPELLDCLVTVVHELLSRFRVSVPHQPIADPEQPFVCTETCEFCSGACRRHGRHHYHRCIEHWNTITIHHGGWPFGSMSWIFDSKWSV